MRTALKVLSIVNIVFFSFAIIGNIGDSALAGVMLMAGSVIAQSIVTLIYIKK